MIGFGEVIMNFLLIFMLVSLFNLVRYMFKIRKIMKVNKDNPNIKGISIVNGEVKVIENEAFPPIQDMAKDLVTDPQCGTEIEKKDAYRIFKNGKEYFFCSWECREKFLANAK